jgi:hypothetical protein
MFAHGGLSAPVCTKTGIVNLSDCQNFPLCSKRDEKKDLVFTHFLIHDQEMRMSVRHVCFRHFRYRICRMPCGVVPHTKRDLSMSVSVLRFGLFVFPGICMTTARDEGQISPHLCTDLRKRTSGTNALRTIIPITALGLLYDTLSYVHSSTTTTVAIHYRAYSKCSSTAQCREYVSPIITKSERNI